MESKPMDMRMENILDSKQKDNAKLTQKADVHTWQKDTRDKDSENA